MSRSAPGAACSTAPIRAANSVSESCTARACVYFLFDLALALPSALAPATENFSL